MAPSMSHYTEPPSIETCIIAEVIYGSWRKEPQAHVRRRDNTITNFKNWSLTNNKLNFNCLFIHRKNVTQKLV